MIAFFASGAAGACLRLPVVVLWACALGAPLAQANAVDAFRGAAPPATCAAPPGGPPAPCGGPASLPTGAGLDIGAGNPINIVSGNKYQREDDMPALPGVLGLELVRHYNSAHAGPQTMNRILGRGWFLSYETQLYPIGATVQIVQADGARHIFSRDPNDPSRCQAADPARGHVRVDRLGGQERYTWVWPEGRRLQFDHRGKLTRITAPTGEVLTLQYSGPRGQLTQVTDPQGRTLRLNLLAPAQQRADRFDGVQTIDTPVGRFGYEYGSRPPEGSPHSARWVIANLVAVQAPGPSSQPPATSAPAHTSQATGKSSAGAEPSMQAPTPSNPPAPSAQPAGAVVPAQTTRRYHYEDPRHPTLLTGISVHGTHADGRPMDERLNSWAYDAGGRAVLSVRGDPAAGADRVSLEHRRASLPGGPPGLTVLTNSRGATTTYRHQVIAGEFRLLEARGAGCSSCGEVDVRYRYDAAGRLTGTVRLDARGAPVSEEITHHDALGRVIRQERIDHLDGRPQTPRLLRRFEYDGTSHRRTLVARPSVVPGREHVVRTTYGDDGQPSRVTEDGFSPLDARGEPSGDGMPLTRSTTYGYARINGHTLLTRVDGPLPNGPAGTPQDSDVTLLHYDERGTRIVGITHPTGLKASFTHDAAGRVIEHTPMDGVTVRRTLDPAGRTLRWQRGDVQVDLQWDAAGRLGRLQRDDGSSDTWVHDAAGRAVAVVDAQGSRHELEHDTEGRLLKALWRDPSGHAPFEALGYEHDDRGRIVGDSFGQRITYDAAGRLAGVRDALDRRTRYAYDAQGRLIAHGQRAEQPGGRLLRTALNVEDPAEVVTRLLYRSDRPDATGVIAANGARTEADVDDFGRTVRLSSPDTGIAHSRYDEADRPVTLTDDASNRTELQHDLLGRLVLRRIHNTARPGEVDEAYWRYPGAWLAEAGNAHQADTYRRDTQGRLVEQVTRLHAVEGSARHEFVTRWRYDAVGRPVEKHLPDGLVVLQSYDRFGQPSRMALRYPNGKEQAIVESVEADAVHGIRQIVFGNGTVTAYARDRRGRIEGVATVARRENAASLPLYVQRLQYDAGGRIVGIERDGSQERYEYDGLDRLVQVDAPNERRRFAYDAVGNRTAVWQPPPPAPTKVGTGQQTPAPQQTLRYQPGSNRLVEVRGGTVAASSNSGIEWHYDAIGNPTTIGQRHYTYGVNGRLQAIAEGGRTLGRYRYNAAGERVAKVTAAGATYFLYAENKIAAEVDSEGRITAHYFYMGHTPLAKIETQQASTNAAGWEDTEPLFWERWLRWSIAAVSGQVAPLPTTASARILFLHTDHLGTPRVGTDAHQRVVWRARFEAFGSAAEGADPDGDGQSTLVNLRLPGQYFDGESGWHYNYFRNFDPIVGRYAQSDPIGLGGGINTYAYSLNAPTMYTDPKGLETYVCRRRLGGTPGSFAPPLLNHTYVCVGSGASMQCGSTTASSGGGLSNVYRGSPGAPTARDQDYYEPRACERRHGEDRCIETCIANELRKPNRPYYALGPLGTDCQEYTDSLLRTCERRCAR